MNFHSFNKKRNMSGVLALLLFCVFAACVLSVLLTGAGAYRRLTQRDQEAYSRRTCAQYIATKVRQAPGDVSLAPFGEGDALVLAEDIEEETYLTRVYCWDGWLRELFAAGDGDFSPEDGEKIIQAQDLSLRLNDGLLSIRVTDPNGVPVELNLTLRTGEEAAA